MLSFYYCRNTFNLCATYNLVRFFSVKIQKLFGNQNSKTSYFFIASTLFYVSFQRNIAEKKTEQIKHREDCLDCRIICCNVFHHLAINALELFSKVVNALNTGMYQLGILTS